MANRPVVLVYQEYTNLSVPTATPELNCCLVGPAYQIADYPEDRTKDDGTLNVAGVYGALNTFADVPAVPTAAPPPALLAGAQLDTASLQVFAESIRGVALEQGALAPFTTVAGTSQVATATDLSASVKPGDWAILKDATAKVLVRRVRSVTAAAIVLTSEFPVDSAAFTNGVAVTWRFERDLPNQQVPTASVSFDVTSGSAQVAGGWLAAGLPVVYAQLFVAYRALRTDLAELKTLSSFNLDSKGNLDYLGKVDARNPLAAAAFVAAQNTNTPIETYAIVSDDSAGFVSARDGLSARNDVYAVVALTSDPSIVKMFGDSFTSSADPQYAIDNGVSQKFRLALGYTGPLPTYKIVMDKTTGVVDPVGHTVKGAGFVDAGVQVGDKVRFLQTATTYLDVAVTNVASNETLQLAAFADPGTTNFEVIRTLDKDGQVTALVALATSIANRRVILCWPDLVDVTGLVDGSKPRLADGSKDLADSQQGYYLAAGVGAMIAALPSHQGLTNFAINGIKRVYNANPYFTDKQLTAISNNGLFVFTQQDPNSLPYIVHELTTDPSTLEFGELMFVKNMDYCSITIANTIAPFLGKWNITDDTLGFIRSAVQVAVDSLVLDKRVRLGGRLKSGKIASLDQSSLATDRVECIVDAKFPMVLNTIGLHVVSG